LVYKGDVPSIQCKTNLDRSISAGETDGLSLVLIDFDVPALAPRLHRSEAALELPENIALFAVCEGRGILEERFYSSV
jgi:hypothetical protein